MPESKAACGHGYLAHKPQRRSTAARSSTALYVVCERTTTLETLFVGGQAWHESLVVLVCGCFGDGTKGPQTTSSQNFTCDAATVRETCSS